MELYQLTLDELDTLTEGCSYIFEQAAYMSLKTKSFQNHLSTTAMNEDKIKVFITVWEQGGEMYMESLKNQQFGYPPLVKDIRWELHLPLASSTTKLDRAPKAQIEFAYDVPKNAIQPSSVQAQTSKNSLPLDRQPNRLLFEMNHKELSDFAKQIELIQGQLDSLSS
ncbi:putative COMM domain containing 10 [Blattamonas nauphoetae]|uniref:COMM domain containing 10 n=1 Tax=Blattamonas nauphoetae TaxID=2049346 RepID=A0ABQ9YL53_9EUKA|nr:putative COMM domain containing 10 [Blattamonas nauphoetae]